MDMIKIMKFLDKRTIKNPETGCWEYTRINTQGYGQAKIKGKFWKAHRLTAMYYLNYDPSSSLIVCHKCNNRRCRNPEHLYIGTDATNVADTKANGNAKGRYSDMTHCINGHEFTLENTFWSTRNDTGRNMRHCRICKRENKTKHRRLQGIEPKIVKQQWVVQEATVDEQFALLDKVN